MGLPAARFGDNVSGDRGAPPVPINQLCAGTVKVNGKFVAVVGSKAAVHGCPITHSDYRTPIIIQGSPTVFAEGKPIARINDPCDCGAMVIMASGNVFVA